jgi:ferredoxin
MDSICVQICYMELLSEDSFLNRESEERRHTSFNLFSLFRNRVTVCGVCTAFRKSYVNPVVNKIICSTWALSLIIKKP